MFTGHNYCLAKGIHVDPDKDAFSWDFGDYFDEMPITKADKRHSLDEMKDIINALTSKEYETFVKALISTEKDIDDDNILDVLSYVLIKTI